MIRISNFSVLRFFLAATILSIASVVYADTFVRDDLIINPSPTNFRICHGGTCEKISNVSFNEEQWQLIKNSFINNQSAESERRSIRSAIATMENIVGKLTDTYNDKGENETDEKYNHYMDCIDESTNTTIYMNMMKRNGLIALHTIEDRENRGFFFNGWPHTTAAIKEISTKKQYAVDSWFLDNGEQPFIIPLKEWFEGWRPPKANN